VIIRGLTTGPCLEAGTFPAWIFLLLPRERPARGLRLFLAAGAFPFTVFIKEDATTVQIAPTRRPRRVRRVPGMNLYRFSKAITN